jgi:hypothetical protein
MQIFSRAGPAAVPVSRSVLCSTPEANRNATDRHPARVHLVVLLFFCAEITLSIAGLREFSTLALAGFSS